MIFKILEANFGGTRGSSELIYTNREHIWEEFCLVSPSGFRFASIERDNV